jgi:hypothetical protein
VDCEELIVGSGLTALGAAIGLAARQVVVLAGDAAGGFRYYADSADAPCAHLGPGGLGQYWHGVIPTPAVSRDDNDGAAFAALFMQFYPHTDPRAQLHEPRLFVPWRPIRPLREWPRLQAVRGARLDWRREAALAIELGHADAGAGAVIVRTAQHTYRAQRVWLAAGCLQTPALLQQALHRPLARESVSDHAIVYLGQIDRAQTPEVPAPSVQRTRDGMWVPTTLSSDGNGLCTLRPARFGFAQLDAGIEQRAAFGLPAGSATRKIAAGASPGLIAEALYTRLGLFAGARRQSVYAQVAVRDAYAFDADTGQLGSARLAEIRTATDAMRTQCPWPGLIASRASQLFLPGIHLHHSLQRPALRDAGLGRDAASLQIVDASDRDDIGPAHHSFRLMLAAALRARRLTS